MCLPATFGSRFLGVQTLVLISVSVGATESVHVQTEIEIVAGTEVGSLRKEFHSDFSAATYELLSPQTCTTS